MSKYHDKSVWLLIWIEDDNVNNNIKYKLKDIQKQEVVIEPQIKLLSIILKYALVLNIVICYISVTEL